MQNNIENKIHSLDTYTVISNTKFDVCFIVISINFYETNKLRKTPTPKIKPNQEGKKIMEYLSFYITILALEKEEEEEKKKKKTRERGLQ